MLNLIQMNLYRMKKAVSTWVLAIVAVAIAVLDFSIMKIYVDDPFGWGLAEITGMEGGMDMMKTITGFLRGTDLLIVLSIFVVIFTNAEQKCGFDKNIIGITKHKWKQTLSRWLSAMIGVTAIMALAYGTFTGLSVIFMNSFSAGDMVAYGKLMLIVYLFYAAFSAVFFFFTTAFKSSAGGLVPSLLITTGVLSLITKLLDLGAERLFHNPKYLPSDFFLEGAYAAVSPDASNGTILRVVVTAAVYLVVALGLSMFMQQKRDVR
ncbi:MAG: hypothetical protein IKG93_07420 [Clostridiales bacterium]|nr:hypothetical protein [Clostridiales bacterium]